jgi:hypothetical protein
VSAENKARFACREVDVRCDVDEEYWCMQWCGEVRPEPAMIPDLGVFLRSAPAYSQAATAREQSRVPPAQRTEKLERRREPFPARLKLPFLLSPGGEDRALAPDQKEQALQ